MTYAESLSKACAAKATFQKWAAERQHIKAVERINDDWERMTAYYAYPKEDWTHLRTSNIVESPFESVRLRTEASKQYKKIEGATAMIWKLLLVAERNFRRIKGPELMSKVASSIRFKDGVESPPENKSEEFKQAA